LSFRAKQGAGINAVYHQRREHILKIVVIKSPRFISGLLRAIFGIKKEEQ